MFALCAEYMNENYVERERLIALFNEVPETVNERHIRTWILGSSKDKQEFKHFMLWEQRDNDLWVKAMYDETGLRVHLNP